MKTPLFIAAALLGLGILFGSTLSVAQDAEPGGDTSCDTPGGEACTPVGQPVCTANGCYQMICNSHGCTLTFTPHDPFKPGNQEN